MNHVLSLKVSLEYICPEDNVLRKVHFGISDKELIYSDIYHNVNIIVKNCSCKKEHIIVLNENG